MNHSRASLICSGIPDPEFRREGPVTSTTIPYGTILLFFCNLPHHSMLPVVPGPPSLLSPPTAAVRHPRHPQPVDAETEGRGRIRNIEFKGLMYTQLAVLNNQCLRDFDTVAFKKWSTYLQTSIGRMHGLYLGGKNHSLLRKSRDQRWFHHAKSCVHCMATSEIPY